MTCGETREYLFAFLDSELDAPLSIELQRHLDGCATCARDAEIERVVCKRLGRMIQESVRRIPVLEACLPRVCGAEITVSRRLAPIVEAARLPRRRVLAMAAVLVFVVTAALWFQFPWGNGVSSTARFTDLLVSDFEHFLAEGSTVHVASPDREQVMEWLRRQTGLAVVLPSSLGGGATLIGGRKCSIDGEPAAFAVYEVDASPVSLVVVAADRFPLSGMRQTDRRGTSYRVDHCLGYTIVARRRGEFVYAVVSRLSEKSLFNWLTDESYEPD